MTLAACSAGRSVKDKTFFFFSYEGLRLRQPSTQQTVVPDAASRQQAPAAMRPYLNAFPIAERRGARGRAWRNSTPAIPILPR